LWRIARHTAIYPKDKRLPDEVLLARKDFQDMADVMEQHLTGRQFLVGDSVTAADFVAAYTLDWANEVDLLSGPSEPTNDQLAWRGWPCPQGLPINPSSGFRPG
jgi:glutathione S-transferase